MKRHKWALIVIGSCFLSLFNAAAFSADSQTGEIEAVISKYFKAFHAKNLDGMVAVSTPTIKIIDYGQSFNLDEWNWFMSFSFKKMVPYDVKLANYRTLIDGNLAHTSFEMSGGKSSKIEPASAVLKRVDGKWLIDYLSIEKQQKWLPWLRDRVNKGQDVSNWFQDYLKENPY